MAHDIFKETYLDAHKALTVPLSGPYRAVPPTAYEALLSYQHAPGNVLLLIC